MRFPKYVDIARLKSRLHIILGIIGTDDKEASDRTKQARRLANEAIQSLNGISGHLMTSEQASAINAKVTASEALILGQLPLEYLLSSLRDSCMEILTLEEGTNGEHTKQEKRFVNEALEAFNSEKMTDEETRRLYLQARQRLDTIFATRIALIDAAHRFMSSLWLRTLFAVLICSIPVIFFAYDYWYWHPEHYHPGDYPAKSAQSAASSPPSFDAQGADKALAALPELREQLANLPTAAAKAKLDLKDGRKFMDSAIYGEDRFDSLVNFIISSLSDDNEAPPKVKELAKQLAEARTPSTAPTEQQTLNLLAAMRDQSQTLSEMENYLGRRAGQRSEAQPSPLPVSEGFDVGRKSYPFARFATLFSVVIMGIAGAFVSNYSRVCALLKEPSPLGISSADRSLRVRFSPFLGGLLAIALSEVFGGHLVQGDLFPMTEQLHRWTDLIWSAPAFSKLMVWGFVAGLSENYVLRVLGNLVGKISFDDKSQKNPTA